MRGVKDGLSIPKGINGSDTYGTMDFTPSETWSEQLEEIDSKDLWAGKNYVRFTIPSEYRASVEIRELEFVGSKEALQSKTLKSAKVASFSSTSGLAEYSGAKLFDAERTVQKGKVTALFTYETPSIPGDIINVTEGATAYRIESPSDITDLRIRIPLDESKIPAGYTTRDVKTYYFDYDHKRWQELPRYMDEGGEGEGDGSGLTTAYQGGTDYINGVIQAPEMPAASAFVPTSLSDIKAANPSAGMTMIQPPTINQQGTASIQYPLAIPKGRNGMQPNLALSYSSEGGESWVGLGWSLNIPSIIVDTRWGVPKFDGTKDSESYLLSGEQLTRYDGYLAHRPYYVSGNIATGQKNRPSGDSTRFHRRVVNGYEEIVRRDDQSGSHSPEDYYWTVTNASGMKFVYGEDENSKVRTDCSSGLCPVTEWLLGYVVDKWGNQIDYTYAEYSYSGQNNSLLDGGREKYISQIDYTISKNSSGTITAAANYAIKFNIENSSVIPREDSRVSFKEGYHHINGLRLKNIEVLYGSTTITMYRLEYDKGDFEKTILTDIVCKKKDNGSTEEFYRHTFNYATTSQVFKSNADQISQILSNYQVKNFRGYTGPLASVFNNPKKYSALGSSKSNGGSAGIRLGLGVVANPISIIPSIKNTFGGYVRWSGNWSYGRAYLEDVNGDGLSDLVYKGQDQYGIDQIVYKEASKNSSGEVSFGSVKTLDGIKAYYKSQSQSFNWGVDVSAGIRLAGGYFGWYNSTSWNTTKNYFCDYNSDGIIDLVDKKAKDDFRVLFGRLVNGEVEFDASSEDAPNQVVKASIVTQPADDDTVAKTEVVKMWVAPLDGSVSLSGSATLSGSDDGVEIGVQHNDSFLKIGTLTNSGSFDFSGISTINVTAYEDTLFFRVDAVENGSGDHVQWNPQIQYNTHSDGFDPNGINFKNNSSDDGFIVSNNSGIAITSGGTHTIDWPTVGVSGLSDDVEFRITRTDVSMNNSTGVESSTSSTEYSYVVAAGTSANVTPSLLVDGGSNNITSFSRTASQNTATYLEFEIISSSNVDWANLVWQPEIEVQSTGHVEFPIPNYSVYNYLEQFDGVVSSSLDFSDGNASTVNLFIQPDLTGLSISGTLQATAHFVVKTSAGDLVGKGDVYYNSSGSPNLTYEHVFCSGPGSCDWPEVSQSMLSSDDLFVEYFTDSKELAEAIAALTSPAEAVQKSSAPDPAQSIDDVNVYLLEGTGIVGVGYLGWGQFAWNGGPEVEINPEDVTVSTVSSTTAGLNLNSSLDLDETDLENLYNAHDELQVANQKFFPLYPKSSSTYTYVGATYNTGLEIIDGNPFWAHYSPTIHVKKGELKPGVLTEFDEEEDVNGFTIADSFYGAYGVRKSTKTRTSSLSYKLSATPNGLDAANTSYQHTLLNNTKSRIKNEFRDINGDGYLDVILNFGEDIQLTNTYGGHEPAISTGYPTPLERSYPKSESWSFAGKPLNIAIAVEARGNDEPFCAYLSDQKELGSSKSPTWNVILGGALGSLPGVIASGENTAEHMLMDINGDGLTDRFSVVNNDLKARMNKGNGLNTSEISVVGNDLVQEARSQESKSRSYGGLDPFYWVDHSFELGVGLGTSTSNQDLMFIDINKDGLVDQLGIGMSQGRKTFYLNLNLGTKFKLVAMNMGQTLQWFNQTASSSGSINGSFSVEFKIPFLPASPKFTASPDLAYNSTNSRTHLLMKDVNGDGYPDLLTSDYPNPNMAMDIYYSQIDESNKLIEVVNPLGGSFDLSYKEVGNKYSDDNSEEWTDYHTSAAGDVYWDMPNSRWVLNQVVVNDGYDIDSNSSDSDGSDSYTTQFEYDGGVYSRRDKKFIGFSRIRTVHPGGVRASVIEYHQADDPQFKKMVKHHFVSQLPKLSYETVNGSKAKETTFTYKYYELDQDGTISSLNETSDVEFYKFESKALFPAIKTQVVNVNYFSTTNNHSRTYTFDYDYYLNVNGFNDSWRSSGTSDDLYSEITYFSPKWVHPDARITNHVKKHRIRIGGSSGSIVRETEVTSLYINSAPAEIDQRIVSGSAYAKTNILYTTEGLVTKVTSPGPSSSRPETSYTYDSSTKTHVKSATNYFGDKVSMEYNIRGQITSQKDPNDNEIEFEYDKFHRLSLVKGPKDPTYSIRFQYMPDGYNPSGSFKEKIPVAATFHYQPEMHTTSSLYDGSNTLSIGSTVYEFDEDNNWSTVTVNGQNTLISTVFVDGLGRTIQSKSDISVYSGSSISERRAVTYSPKYDSWGRIIEEYQPGDEGSTYNSTAHPLTLSFGQNTSKSTEITFDNLSRKDLIKFPRESGATPKAEVDYSYSFSTSYQGGTLGYVIKIEDPVGQESKAVYNNVGELIAQTSKPASTALIATFEYDELGQLEDSETPEGEITSYTYDNLGRLISRDHPDAGTTTYSYDKGSNIIEVVTANLTSSTPIVYTFDHGRLTTVEYPNSNNLNKVSYTYGDANTAAHKTAGQVGRIRKVEQGSTTQKLLVDEMQYDKLGNMAKQIRTIWTPTRSDITFTTDFQYDSWGRMVEITYPDAETVRYNYGYGGEVHKVYGTLSNSDVIEYASLIGYNKWGNRNRLEYGNLTNTDFGYDNFTLRLDDLYLEDSGSQDLLDKTYTYYKNGNVKKVDNVANYVTYTYNKQGGNYEHNYEYDGANRLSLASGSWTGVTGTEAYELTMSYNDDGAITQKYQKHVSSISGSPATDYNQYYTYQSGQPHALNTVTDGSDVRSFIYDSAGNILKINFATSSTTTHKELLKWDESNRLQADFNLGGLHYFSYDYSGERIIKGSLIFDDVAADGRPVSGSDFTSSDQTVYVNPFMVYITKPSGEHEYIKHFYVGSERIASAIGGETFNDNNSGGQNPSTESLTVHPIWSTLSSIMDDFSFEVGSYYSPSGDESVLYEEPSDCITAFESDQTEYENCLCQYFPDYAASQNINCDEYKPIYWYHPDYLGNTEFVTDRTGRPYQHFYYSPFGEEIVYQAPGNGSYESPYRFNAKEVDPETGLHYYGARYYNSNLSIWLSVDPILKHHESPYAAFSNNPIMLIDPDGRDTSFADNQARNDFESALNTVNSKVSHYQQRVNENKALANQKGFGAAVKRFFRNEKADAQNLANWQKLESDFDNITDPNTAMVEYSSSTAPLGANENGLTQPQTNGDVKVNIRAGHISAYIHENRHVNQWFSRTSGLVRNTDLFDEIQAFQYQAIFDPSGVQNLIIRGAQAQHGANWQSIRPNYGLTDLVKYLYPGIIQSTTDVK